MSILLDLKFDAPDIARQFSVAMPDHSIINWPDKKSASADLTGIRYAVVWNADHGLLASLPNLEVIFSGGAGVDHLFLDPQLPCDLPIVRFVDPDLTNRMSEWVVLQCLMQLRQQRAYDKYQKQRKWQPMRQIIASDVRVGMMGLGELGLDAAQKLKMMGFKVHGWSRSAKSIEGMETFAGKAGLKPFLSQTNILISLLPLTDETINIINAELIAALPKNGPVKPVIINAGRGGSQVEIDLIAALENGTLGGVSLDVFETEPLGSESPLWNLENAILTPHVAAESSIRALAGYVSRQIDKFENGNELENLIDSARGY